jgi:arylsulfatase
VIRHNGRFVKTKGFCTDVFFQQALGWIRRQNATGRPMFVMITPNAPHAPMMAPQQYKQPFVDAGFDADTAARYGMIVNIDDNMGLLMKKLADWEMEANTLVIFMTDNGQASRNAVRNGKKVVLHGAGLRAGKNSVHEGGTRVPAFWRWKGVLAEGRDVSALTAHIDIFPTFVELAGAKIPAGMPKLDGRSMLPLLEQSDAPWADRFLFVHKGRWERGSDPDKFKYLDCAVRNARFRLVNHRQLYDISADPGETMDVAGQHPEVVKQMQLAYEQWWADTRPLLVNENVPLAPQRPYFVWYEEQLKREGIGQWQAPAL